MGEISRDNINQRKEIETRPVANKDTIKLAVGRVDVEIKGDDPQAHSSLQKLSVKKKESKKKKKKKKKKNQIQFSLSLLVFSPTVTKKKNKPNNIILHTTIIRQNNRGSSRVVLLRLLPGNLLDQVLQVGVVEGDFLARELNLSQHTSVFTDSLGQHTGVDTVKGRDSPFFQPISQSFDGVPVRGDCFFFFFFFEKK